MSCGMIEHFSKNCPSKGKEKTINLTKEVKKEATLLMDT